MLVKWTDEALDNLWQIQQYIGRNSPEHAERFVDYLIKEGESIVLNPHIGRIVPEFSVPEIRELIAKNYRIVYRVHEQVIEILSVFEGHKLLSVIPPL
jgi:addiction module RelE/StbE family toxin